MRVCVACVMRGCDARLCVVCGPPTGFIRAICWCRLHVLLLLGGLRQLLPAPGLAEVDIVSDRHLLRRIVFNLVSNAVKYTDTGFVRVKLSADATGRAVQLAVQDSGPGIPPDKLDDVFRDYVRLNPMQAAEGLGIGLSIVRRASELLIQFWRRPPPQRPVTARLVTRGVP